MPQRRRPVSKTVSSIANDIESISLGSEIHTLQGMLGETSSFVEEAQARNGPYEEIVDKVCKRYRIASPRKSERKHSQRRTRVGKTRFLSVFHASPVRAQEPSNWDEALGEQGGYLDSRHGFVKEPEKHGVFGNAVSAIKLGEKSSVLVFSKRSGKFGRYFRVLDYESQCGLSLEGICRNMT